MRCRTALAKYLPFFALFHDVLLVGGGCWDCEDIAGGGCPDEPDIITQGKKPKPALDSFGPRSSEKTQIMVADVLH